MITEDRFIALVIECATRRRIDSREVLTKAALQLRATMSGSELADVWNDACDAVKEVSLEDWSWLIDL